MRNTRGMSLLEVLIGLSIGVMLFTAVASAVYASSNAMKGNERFFKATQTARIAMLQMTTLIRQSYECQPGGTEPPLAGPGPVDWEPTSELKVRRYNTGTSQDFFAYRFRDGVLYYCPNPDVFSPTDPVLARDISELTFRAQSWKRLKPDAPEDADPSLWSEWVLGNIQIDLTVTVNNQSIRLSNSVVPRKAMTVR